jgi:hypothetical protein
MTQTLRLLVKARRGTVGAQLAFGGAAAPLTLEPLLKSIEGATRAGLGMAAAPVWHLATAQVTGANAWDACHQLHGKGLGIAGGDVTFAEPDLEQQWVWETPNRLALGLTTECGPALQQKNGVYPIKTPDFWHLTPEYSQLLAAQQAVNSPADPAQRVRIAHLDTGYDDAHKAKPQFLRKELQRNFVDADRPNDATDRPTALLNPMFGHGTGTLSLLAGKIGNQVIGAACNLDVVPVRVANWVTLFTNSSIAQAFDYVHGLWDDRSKRVHVVTMSMGGLASAAWADAVNALYERGIFVVTAAGNNFGNLPTHYIVYPARFRRVVAACGAMSDGRPYADLPKMRMAGCYGPQRKESASAMSAFTPNVPWARFGCSDIVDFDGGGTSAATPQIAAAAALWMQKNRAALDAIPDDRAWMRVEAVRKALFDKAVADPDSSRRERLGLGLLKANDALGVAVANEQQLTKQEVDDASFSLLRVLFGFGVAAQPPSAQQKMLELEALQLSQRSDEIERLLAGDDPDQANVQTLARAKPILEALADHPHASQTLKNLIAARLGGAPPRPAPPAPAKQAVEAPAKMAEAASAPTPSAAKNPRRPPPAARRLRVFAFDPVLQTRLETLAINQATLEVKWEESLKPGPVGEYIEVVDVDPANNRAYAPVDLNDPTILAQNGLAPTEGDPQFHQQMVYAVAMKTIRHFERALGRVALWRERRATVDGEFGFRFVRRLRIYPHALPEANAYYSPDKRALLFGHFPASQTDAGDNLPGGLIFSCLSHDIVAHETTHALLDGLHPRFEEATNADVLAFHEAFADIVALFQHFTLPEALRSEIRKSRGDLSLATLLAGLALQFGQAIGKRGVLRSAIARLNKDGKWERIKPSPTDYNASEEPHERGAVLVAAVFDAFLQIYGRDIEDLKRLATGGTGVLPQGEISHDLVERLAAEASKSATRVLETCIRALDYCPPFDLTFGEYLRALITADRDLAPDDDGAYRVAFISAFRARGIFPQDVNNLSVEGLAWRPPDFQVAGLASLFRNLSGNWKLNSDRHAAYLAANENARLLHDLLLDEIREDDALRSLGFVLTKQDRTVTLDGRKGQVSRLEMHSVRPAQCVGPNGEILNNVVIEITQRWKPDGENHFYRGGCTIIADMETGEIRYVIRKRIGNTGSIQAQQAFALRRDEGSAFANYFGDRGAAEEPFAMLHRGF